MQKHPRITAGNCNFKLAQVPLALSNFAFQKYLNHKNFHHAAGPGVSVYELPCGCFVWQFASGGRYLTKLPFWPVPK